MQQAHIGVRMVNKNGKSWQDLSDHVDLRRRLFATTQVDHDPRHVTQEAQRNRRTDERDERLYDAEWHDVVSTVWTVTYHQQPATDLTTD